MLWSGFVSTYLLGLLTWANQHQGFSSQAIRLIFLNHDCWRSKGRSSKEQRPWLSQFNALGEFSILLNTSQGTINTFAVRVVFSKGGPIWGQKCHSFGFWLFLFSGLFLTWTCSPQKAAVFVMEWDTFFLCLKGSLTVGPWKALRRTPFLFMLLLGDLKGLVYEQQWSCPYQNPQQVPKMKSL